MPAPRKTASPPAGLTLAAPPAPAAAPAAGTSAAPLRAWLDAAGQAFPERGPVLRCLTLAALSPSPVNVMLIGPPGTAKTTLAKAVGRALGWGVFARTFTPFSVDDDVLGTVDLAAMQAGRLARCEPGSITDPAFGVLVFDELPRGSRGVQTVALSVLADRETPDGRPVPARVVVSTANTRLTDDDQRALADRMTLTVPCDRTADRANLRRVLFRRRSVGGVAPAPATLPPIPAGVVDAVRARAAAVDFPDDVADAVADLVITLRKPPTGAPVDASERRLIGAMDVVAAAAALDDRDVVAWSDLDVLRYVLDDGPESRPTVEAAIRAAQPAYVAALAAVDEACAAAVALAERIEARKETVGPALSAAHADREPRLLALPGTLAPHGPDVVARARATVDRALAQIARMAAARSAADLARLTAAGH